MLSGFGRFHMFHMYNVQESSVPSQDKGKISVESEVGKGSKLGYQASDFGFLDPSA